MPFTNGTGGMLCMMGTNVMRGMTSTNGMGGTAKMGGMEATNAMWLMLCTQMTNQMNGMPFTNGTGGMLCMMGTNVMGEMTSTADMGGMGGMGGMDGMTSTQGMEMEILRFYVDREGKGAGIKPAALSPIQLYDRAQAKRTRTFTLDMLGMTHAINSATFSLNRVDFTVPFGELEIWEFRNTSDEPHPMHPHGALFQVLDRNGNANLPPEDTGWKDTVLVWPNETVRILIRFDAYAGLFVSHCHNLEHEDTGMMQNFEILPPVPARMVIARQGNGLKISFPSSASDYILERAETLDLGAKWTLVPQSVVADGEALSVTVTEPAGNGFYRLNKPIATPSQGDGHAGHHGSP